MEPVASALRNRAFELHRSIPVAAGYFEYYGFDSLFSESEGRQGGCDFQKMDTAGIRCFGVAVANGGGPNIPIGGGDHRPAGDADWAFERGLRGLDAAMEQMRGHPRIRIVETAADLPERDAAEVHVIPLVTSSLWMRDLEALDTYFEHGLRISHCAGHTWCRATPPQIVNGDLGPDLNAFGEQVVERMNELGIVLDMAHMSDESTEAILRVSTKPVMDGHTSSTTAVPECRGHSDRTLRMIADGGGVVGIHFADHMWCREVWEAGKYRFATEESPLVPYYRHLFDTISDPNEIMRLRKNKENQKRFFANREMKVPDPDPTDRIATVQHMADHIDHLVNVMGVEHVGLGGDVNGITPHSWPSGCDDVGELPHLTAELMRRGWSDDALKKFLSENWLRVFRDTLPKAKG